MLLHILSYSSSIAIALADSCWRNTDCQGPLDAAFTGPWDDNIYAPDTRLVTPARILSSETLSATSDQISTQTLQQNASAVVYDFGKEVGGIIRLNYTTTGSGTLGLAFSEAKSYIGLASDSSNGKFARGNGDYACDDGALYSSFSANGKFNYTMDDEHLRGGFRYLTIFLLRDATSNTTVNLEGVTLEIGFHPTWSNLRAYQGYFHSDDEDLNKIWYSGAYTLQTNYVPVDTGRQVPNLSSGSGWANNGTMANGSTVIVDGAKRDRAVWPGDMGIAVPASFVSLGDDLDSVKTALQAMYDYQRSDGSLPFAGPPLLLRNSDTYHMWTMIGTYNYILYTNDTVFLVANWQRYTTAMEYVYNKVQQPFDLLNVTGTQDWARQATSGYTAEANMILYHTLITGSKLALWIGNATLSETYSARAATLTPNIIQYLYDDTYGAFKDNVTNTTLYPQDANSMALLFDVVPGNSTAAASISSRLTENWTSIGAEAPELPNNISPFASSFEIQGHLVAGRADRALELIRRSWGWYLNNPNGTESTVIEGYLTDGSFGYRDYRGYKYDASYVSHAHGWSAGPTSALTEYVLGLRIVERLGSRWVLAPQFGDLTEVEGGYVTSLGKFQAGWKVEEGGKEYEVWWKVPEGTKGSIVLPPLPSSEGPGVARMQGEDLGTVEAGGTLTFEVEGGEGSVILSLK